MKRSLLKLTLGITALTLGSVAVNAQCISGPDTLFFTGNIDTWTVPAGVTSITIEARGAEGGTDPSSAINGGLGSTMVGDFTVTPGAVLSVLVGEMPARNGGGGGTFVVDASNNPLIVAGAGGGSSEGTDSQDKDGQVGTTGGTGASGGGVGGSAGNGGAIGASFASGAGGGLLTDGADGWTANSGGDAFVNGGSGANIGFGIGGFGGGGNGSGNSVGGGGGGYSGGGSGSNSTGTGGVGGGGASFNSGTNPTNTGGINTGNGMVIINYDNKPDTSTTLVSQTITSNETATGATYRWLDCNNSNAVILGETAISYTATTNGDYAVEVTVNGCADTSACVTISLVGINDLLLEKVSLYPNPTTNIVTVDFGSHAKALNYSIISIEGRVVKQVQNVFDDKVIIDLSNESKGIYTLKIQMDSSTKFYKLIKK